MSRYHLAIFKQLPRNVRLSVIAAQNWPRCLKIRISLQTASGVRAGYCDFAVVGCSKTGISCHGKYKLSGYFGFAVSRSGKTGKLRHELGKLAGYDGFAVAGYRKIGNSCHEPNGLAGYCGFVVSGNVKSGKSCHELGKLAGFSVCAVVETTKAENPATPLQSHWNRAVVHGVGVICSRR